MATPHSAVVTAKTGPDRTVTAMTLANVESIEFDLVNRRLFVEVDQAVTGAAPGFGASGDNIKEFDLAVVTAVTVAITAGVYVVTVA